MAQTFVLHQFAFSHYCEKVRWGLSHGGLTYRVENYLPFLHAGRIKKLSGQSAVPVLAGQGDVVTGSADILAYIDELHDGPALYPADALLGGEVKAWERRLDNGGATLRAALFHELVLDPDFMLAVFTSGRGRLTRWSYGLLFKVMLPKMRTMLAQKAPDPDALRQKTNSLLDDIERATRATGYLVGDTFTAADLTAASLLYPLFFPDGTPGAELMRRSETGRRWLADWASHPVDDYVKRMYRDHRIVTR